MLIPSCDKDDGPSGSNARYFEFVVGKWISYLEIHHSIRSATGDTLNMNISFDTNFLVFEDDHLRTYHLYPSDSNEYIIEFIREITDSVLYFGGIKYNTGDVIFVNREKLIFKRFKGLFVPIDSKDTIIHYLTYYCNRSD